MSVSALSMLNPFIHVKKRRLILNFDICKRNNQRRTPLHCPIPHSILLVSSCAFCCLQQRVFMHKVFFTNFRGLLPRPEWMVSKELSIYSLRCQRLETPAQRSYSMSVLIVISRLKYWSFCFLVDVGSKTSFTSIKVVSFRRKKYNRSPQAKKSGAVDLLLVRH